LGIWIQYATTRYQPPFGWIEGLYNELESKNERKTMPGTWELFGFETIIWGKKCLVS
jgi:hypothetical protein